MTEFINSFTGEFDFLSNFYPVQIKFMGLRFPTVEHAYVGAKNPTQKHLLKIANMKADEAGLAKNIGSKIKLRSDWEQVRVELMNKFLNQKFNDPTLASKLLHTDPAQLVEGNWWHDNFWGKCWCRKCDQIKPKQNQLGILLMQKRDELKLIQ